MVPMGRWVAAQVEQSEMLKAVHRCRDLLETVPVQMELFQPAQVADACGQFTKTIVLQMQYAQLGQPCKYAQSGPRR